MDGDVRLVVHFPGSTEVRTVRRLPRRGQRISSERGGTAYVSEVLPSGVETYTVVCVSRPDFLRELRGRPFADLSAGLLRAARRAVPLKDGSKQPMSDAVPVHRRRQKRYVASFATAKGEVLQHYAQAASDSEAEREAREAARRLGMRFVGLRRA